MNTNSLIYETIKYTESRGSVRQTITLNLNDETYIYSFKDTQDYMTGMDCSDYNYHFETDIVEGKFEVAEGSLIQSNCTLNCVASSGRHITDDEECGYVRKTVEGINPSFELMTFKLEGDSFVRIGNEKEIWKQILS